MSPIISAVVCTYNRAELLRGCIESLLAQTIDKMLFEVVIVDNNSTDNTARIVEPFLSHDIVRYVVEINPGLSFARNRGIQEAEGSYIAFIDDDAKATSDWLASALVIINSNKPMLDCLGGPIYPYYLTSKPTWFKDQYEIRSYGDSDRFLTQREKFSGSNMIWNRDSLQEIGMFDTNFGVIKNELKLGEETAAIEKLWALKKTPQVFYSPKLVVYHLVPGSKMSVAYRLKRKFAQGLYSVYISGATGVLNIFLKSIISFLLIGKNIVRFFLRFFAHPQFQNWLIEDGGMVATSLGYFVGYLGIKLKLQNDADLEM